MEKSGGSRLLQMQARFQQKQMAEREMKIASLYEAQQTRALTRLRHSPGTPAPPAPHAPPAPAATLSSPPHDVHVQPGKVRQMFEERRTKGIDKSYPLKPINNNTLPRPPARLATTTRLASEKKSVKTSLSSHTILRKQRVDNMLNGASDINQNHEPDHAAFAHREFSNTKRSGSESAEGYRLEDETFPEALAPAHTPRETPPPAPPAAPAPPATHLHKRIPPKMNGVGPKVQTTPAPRPAPARAPLHENKRSPETSRVQAAVPPRAAPPVAVQQKRSSPSRSGGAGSGSTTEVQPRQSPTKPLSRVASSAPAAGAGEGLACGVCGRRFAPDRLDKHEAICKKAHAKKRKPFDVLKHRLAGTEAEPFIAKTRRGAGAGAGTGAGAGAGKAASSNWRQKHEEFIRAIRAAKQVQAHLDAGGKLSDLPPPPPSENPDYVTCPSCKRRFNQAAAERHIPKCSGYQFNKPKAPPRRR